MIPADIALIFGLTLIAGLLWIVAFFWRGRK